MVLETTVGEDLVYSIVAQLAEQTVDSGEVEGSSPFDTTYA